MDEDTRFFKIVQVVIDELDRATKIHPEPMRSPHEGFAILKEEVDELWEVVRGKDESRDPLAMQKEAVQVAAMALRFLSDVLGDTFIPRGA